MSAATACVASDSACSTCFDPSSFATTFPNDAENATIFHNFAENYFQDMFCVEANYRMCRMINPAVNVAKNVSIYYTT